MDANAVCFACNILPTDTHDWLLANAIQSIELYVVSCATSLSPESMTVFATLSSTYMYALKS